MTSAVTTKAFALGHMSVLGHLAFAAAARARLLADDGRKRVFEHIVAQGGGPEQLAAAFLVHKLLLGGRPGVTQTFMTTTALAK
jgi:hypothetical protein